MQLSCVVWLVRFLSIRSPSGASGHVDSALDGCVAH